MDDLVIRPETAADLWRALHATTSALRSLSDALVALAFDLHVDEHPAGTALALVDHPDDDADADHPGRL
jgi:hypothetical protein